MLISATTQRKAARVAGVSLLLICLCGVLSNSLILPGDGVATAHNIMTHERRFRIGVLGELVMINFDILLAAAFYVLLKPVGAGLAFLGALWRFANAIAQGFGIIVSLVAFDDVSDALYRGAFSVAQMAALMRQLFDIHDTAMEIGLVFFGLGAAVHSYLLWRSRYIPRLLSVPYFLVASMIFIACMAIVVSPEVEKIVVPWIFAPDFGIELLVALWLTFKGAYIPEPVTVTLNDRSGEQRSPGVA